MNEREIRETLEKQLQLLSERSQKTDSNVMLCKLTEAMTNLISAPWPSVREQEGSEKSVS